MEQLTQKLKSGEMTIEELPMPIVSKGMVLVRNHYSLISAGTEGSLVKTARKSLIGKAKERPQQVKQVMDALKKQGPVATYRAVMKKLDAYSPLGYSSSGEVMAVGEGVQGFSVGDKVACAGAGYANHAEIVCVPKNLCVKLPEEADLKLASYNTLGAIALQGVRQADLRLCESCAVIGLGLLGQLTCLMLQASGVKTFGIDVDAKMVQIAKEHGIDPAWQRSDSGIVDSILRETNGMGADAVIITAGTSSLDPVNFAGEIARRKGCVIVVGAVPTGFDRDNYYQKELDLRMSCSYGPGRYDLQYEEKGIDYPAAYVRWTENRNMAAFQELMQAHRARFEYLSTHVFPLEEAPKAYELILERNEPFLGIVLKYDISKSHEPGTVQVRPPRKATTPPEEIALAFIGAGSYAQGNLLPYLPSSQSMKRHTVMTNSGTTSKRVAERFGFEFCTSNVEDILSNEAVNTVFIATRHDSHAGYVQDSLGHGKNLFVEKPLCLTESELDAIVEQYETVSREGTPPQLMIGFNRRFSPHSERLRQSISKGPMSMIYRVNAGSIPKDTWIQDPEIGGGRIVGEACHFIDYLTFMCGSLPLSVYAAALPDPEGLNDIITVTLRFQNGSIGTVHYFANGSKELPKEYLEIYQAGKTGVLEDFKNTTIYGSGKLQKFKTINQDKGQKRMMRDFLEGIENGTSCPISIEEIFAVTRASFAVAQSLANREEVLL